jgi:hypothetical protein
MEEREEDGCNSASRSPLLAYTKSEGGLKFGDHAFLTPLTPCCAKIASPYWARIIGTIVNTGPDETFATINATFFDESGIAMGMHNDSMILDPGQKGEFDIKVPVFYEGVRTYGLEALATEP